MLCMLQNHQPILVNAIFHHIVMKSVRELCSLKFIYLRGNKNAYNYIVFLFYIKWKTEKQINVKSIKMIGILEILV